MLVPCKDIHENIKQSLSIQVKELKEKGVTPKLVTILIGEAPEQLSFVAIKRKVAESVGIDFEFKNLKKTPTFERFAKLLKTYSSDPGVTGIIIQQPLPSQLSTDTIYRYIGKDKEIEGHMNKSLFLPPLGLATITILKYIFFHQDLSTDITVNLKKDSPSFKKALKNKKIVLMGRGLTGGLPIGKTLSMLKANFININSSTHNPQQYIREADIIVTATGRHIISAADIKPGAILLNVGLRKENGKLKGDYYEEDVDPVASHYTPTPGGIGPIDVLYLFKNLVEAANIHYAKPPKAPPRT